MELYPICSFIHCCLWDSPRLFHVSIMCPFSYCLTILLLLLLLSRFSRVRLCATPETAAYQAPLSLGFSGKNTGVGCHFLLQCMKVKNESEVAQSCRLFVIPWTAAYQAPPSMGFSRQECWSGVPLPSLMTKVVQFNWVAQSCLTLRPHGLQHIRLPCPSPTFGACSNSCLSSWWCHLTISSSAVPFSSCFQSFPASRSFQISQFFASSGQSIGASASASVLPMNI